MGITEYNFNRLMKHLPVDSLCELGDQWLFIEEVPHHTFSKNYFRQKDKVDLIKKYVSIDYIERPSVDVVLDLNKDIHEQEAYDGEQYDLVTDFGTMEHCVNYYQALKNAYSLCKVGGAIMFSTPKVDSWPGHGFHTFTPDFFIKRCELTDMKLLFVSEYPACGNFKDGWEVCVDVIKTKENFPTQEEFNDHLRDLYQTTVDNSEGRSQTGLTQDEVTTYEQR